MSEVLFGLHIPKCAGTTVLNEFEKHFKQDLFQSTSLIRNFRQGRPDISDTSNCFPYLAYFGHHLCDEMLKNIADEVFLFSFLRDPIERAVSHFEYVNRMRKSVGYAPITIDSFCKNFPTITQFLLKRFPSFVDEELNNVSEGEKALSILKKFDYIGDTSRMNEFSKVLSKRTGLIFNFSERANAAPKKLTDNQNQLISHLTDYLNDDIVLYDNYNKIRKYEMSSKDKEFRRNYKNSEYSESKFLDFYAKSLVKEFVANNELNMLKNIKFSNKKMNELVCFNIKNQSKL